MIRAAAQSSHGRVADVTSVRIGRRIEIEFAGEPDLDTARKIADKLLADVKRLQTKTKGLTYQPEELANGANGLGSVKRRRSG